MASMGWKGLTEELIYKDIGLCMNDYNEFAQLARIFRNCRLLYNQDEYFFTTLLWEVFRTPEFNS